MRNLHSIKPQDILLLLKLIVSGESIQKVLSSSLEISQAEVSHGLMRLKNSGLLMTDGTVGKGAAAEFLVSGLKYIFPPDFGSLSAGVPTSFAHPDFKFVKYKPDQIIVWPFAEGSVRGLVLRPIHPSFPAACLKDNSLYKLASLVEMVRSGKAREKKIAAKEIYKLLGVPNG